MGKLRPFFSAGFGRPTKELYSIMGAIVLKQVESEKIDRYLSKKSLACFSMVKPSESATTLEQVSRDLFSFVQQFSTDKQIRAMHSYKLLERVLQEQCTVIEATNDKQFTKSIIGFQYL